VVQLHCTHLGLKGLHAFLPWPIDFGPEDADIRSLSKWSNGALVHRSLLDNKLRVFPYPEKLAGCA